MNRLGKLVAVTATSTAVLGMMGGSTLHLIANRFVVEMTRPSVIIDENAPVWGGWKFPSGSPEPPVHLRRVIPFVAADGTQLRGEFWSQPKPAATIVLSHGFRLPSAKFRPVGALEYAHGSNIFLFDYRGHGESTQLHTSGGNAEVRDLAAAVDIAAQQPETILGNVFIHGFSMGAAVALLLPPRPEIAGIIADSPYAQLDEMIHYIVVRQLLSETERWHVPRQARETMIPLFTHATLWCGRMLFRLRFGHPLVARPERVLRRRGRALAKLPQIKTPAVLLIHAVGDPLQHAQRIEQVLLQGGISVETYYMPSDVHCGGYGYAPEQYTSRLQAFVERHRV